MASEAGLNFHWGHASLQRLTILDTVGHGCAFLDYDGDGRLDILLVGSSEARLYHNEGNGRFTDVTDRALPKPPPHAHFLGCAVADYDGDGHPDIFLTGYGVTALYHNEGNGTFRDVTAGSSLEARGPYDWTTSAAWADVDGDGRLDLYVCRYVGFTPAGKQLCPYKTLDGERIMMSCAPTAYPPLKGSLYHNEGNGHFRDITREAGLADTHGDGLGCMFCDINGDGRPDLYIANDVKPCDLYLNTGHGHFKNVGVESGVAFGADGALQSGMGVDWGDYDNDGRFDLVVANFAGQPKSLYHNEGNGTFTNASYTSGIGAVSLTSLAFGAAFIDYDNDSLLDLAFTNGHVQSEVEKVDSTTSYFQNTQLFHNLGGGHFADVSVQAGADFIRKIVGRGIAVGDYDNDGREDLLVVNDEGAPLLLHNECQTSNHWLTLHCLLGPHKWYAIGARVTITLLPSPKLGSQGTQTAPPKLGGSGGRGEAVGGDGTVERSLPSPSEVRAGRGGAGEGEEQIAEVRSDGSYLSANSPEVHFGLGSASQVDTVQVRWPDGRTSLFRHVPADHIYRITLSSRT